jgi:hypothetical protein
MYSISATGLYLLVAICFIFLNPYRDAAFCGGCFISTRAARATGGKNVHGGDARAEGDSTDGEDPERGPDTDTEEGFTNATFMDKADPSLHAAENREVTESLHLREIDSIDNDAEQDAEDDVDAAVLGRNRETSANEDQTEDMDGTPRQLQPPALSMQTTANEEDVTNDEGVPGTEDAAPTCHTRHPDFLDMCCGDPLELEKHMSPSNVEKKEE